MRQKADAQDVRRRVPVAVPDRGGVELHDADDSDEARFGQKTRQLEE
jgi:hypothetical protein